MVRKQIQVEPQTQKRRGTGLIAYDPERTYDGFTLFAPLTGDGGEVYLIDMEGKVAHQWKLPYPAKYAYLLENGNLFYNGWVPPADNDLRFPHWPLYKNGVILEANWKGDVIWDYKNVDTHHDARRTKNGNNILLAIEKTPEDVARKIPGEIASHGIWSDRIIEVTPAGKTVWEWHAWEHLDQLKDQPVHSPEDPHHWPHGNSIEETPNGDILVSFRNISTVVIISKKTGEIAWKLGHDILAQQHAPTFLDNGHILIFDNGTQRKIDPRTYSRVIEVDPKTNKIVWEYHDKPSYNFYSSFISGARRLPNGNTLITEGLNGRIFEVTPKGEVVWEYISPYFSKLSRDSSNFLDGGSANSIFRSFRYAPEEIPFLKNRS